MAVLVTTSGCTSAALQPIAAGLMAEVPGLVSVVHSIEADIGTGITAAAAADQADDDDPMAASSTGVSNTNNNNSGPPVARQQKKGRGNTHKQKQQHRQQKGGRQGKQQQQQRGARALAVASSTVLAGVPHLVETLSGLQFHVSPHSFFQTNTKQAELLYQEVLQAVQQYYAAAAATTDGASLAAASTASSSSSSSAVLQQQPGTLSGTVLDLYCGTGTISLLLASRLAGICRRVVGFDVSAFAIADARANAARNGVDNVQFVCGDLTQLAQGELLGSGNPGTTSSSSSSGGGKPDSQARIGSFGKDSNRSSSSSSSSSSGASLAHLQLQQQQQQACQPDVVVVDPARAGLSRSVVDHLLRCGAWRVVYVSCNAATQARDLQLLCGGAAAAAAAAGDGTSGDGGAGCFRLVSWRGVDMFPQTDHLETVVVLDRC
jgi:23S rRNA (uracil1939-C5)-methyltransferase